MVGGKYAFPKDTGLSVLVPMLHRDRSVWGDDAEEFNPDRFRPERFKSRAAQRLSAVRHRAARLHRPPVRPAGSNSRPWPGVATVRIHRSPQLPAAHQVDPDRQTRRLLDQAAPADRSRPAGHRSRRPPLQRRRLRRNRDGARRPPVTARRCWCCSGRTWARPRASPTGSAGRGSSAATRSPSPRSTTTAPSCPRRVPC